MFLATTALTEFWDKTKEILFLGPWCLNYRRKNEWSKLDYHVMENPWNDREEFYRTFCYTDTIYEQMLKYLTRYLNKFHKTSHSERYWRILIGSWLRRYIYAVYDRYYHLLLAFKNHSPLETWCLSSDCFIIPQNISHFNDLYIDDFYNLQLYSQILGLIGYNFPNFKLNRSMLSKKPNRMDYKEISKIKEIAKGQIKHFYTTLINRVAKRKKIILCDLYIPRNDVWKIVCASRFKTWPLEIQWESNWPNCKYSNQKAREGLKIMPANDDFSQVLVQTLPINFPKIYLEGYHKSRQQILKEWKKFPEIIMSSVGWFFNEYFKFFAAEACEKGTRLLACQHGGGYGIGKIPVEKQEIKVSDVFYSWGWTSKENSNKVRPLPNPRLSNKLSKDALSNQTQHKIILFVGTSYPRYMYDYFSIPVNSQFDEYLNMRKDFVRSLAEKYRSFLLFRLYPCDYGRYESERLKKEFPTLHFDNHRLSFDKQLLKTRIVVIDHPMSSYLEALSYNFPCILFWNPNYWEARDEAVPFFEMLRQAGILFDTAELAAAKLMEIYNYPLHWWLSEKVQSTRIKFVKRFALGNRDWLKFFLSELTGC